MSLVAEIGVINVAIGDNPNEYDNAAHYMVVCRSHHKHKGCLGNKEY